MMQVHGELFGNLSESDVPETARDYLKLSTDLYKLNALRFASECKSPIEQILAVALWFDFIIPERSVTVRPQHRVNVDGKTYRLDFAIIHNQDYVPEKDRCLIAIECDGHNYHERTKEQAKHDKQRDRALQLAGWHVLRFTGSEIVTDPIKCVTEISELFWELTGSSVREELEGKV